MFRIFGKKNDTINIFSVASGHLYERFLMIMIRSVLKNTKSPVKFWFIENFLSPDVKRDLAVLSKEWDFEVEFVTCMCPLTCRIL